MLMSFHVGCHIACERLVNVYEFRVDVCRIKR